MIRRGAEVEVVHVPAKVTALAARRTAGILRWWALTGNWDLAVLVCSVYLQGIEDGYTVKENENARATPPSAGGFWIPG